ncbi:beta-glucuronidase [Sodiomyces alkalinus F11]|uniref:Beta-glucuronidase n=1 Tax=Sodiomyces alkalinus (strain CBS 110278 / VKM F-3762 / F11) TaxID=1314773 RepID=A0A3N2PYF4_SODAK|nr:beta-glucuronidase [Sodiomyces alkalinus F11]ROT39527.1 beta-glucuronidase [Sodiomyces alkalinus F11]
MSPYHRDLLDPIPALVLRVRENLNLISSYVPDRLVAVLYAYLPTRTTLETTRNLLLAAASLAPSPEGPYLAPGPGSAHAVLDAFMSYSIEFVFWPDFAGNCSHPNTFSDNLLQNLGNLQGVRPYVRVGGNTQDYALYNESLFTAVHGIYDYNRSRDYPTTVQIGPSFFESYSTFNDTKFTHGFNLALGAIRPEGWQTLIDTVPLACRAIGQDNLDRWEYGNEPDLYSVSAQGPVRPLTWNAETYVAQWLNGTRRIREALEAACPAMLDDNLYSYAAPSNGGVYNPLQAEDQWAAGLNSDGNVGTFSTHNYISGAETPGVTLQETLMNHHTTTHSVDAHVRTYRDIVRRFGDVPPHILGEHNSLYHQGKPGLSNSFGAALWGVDFNLYAASVGIKRVHMHMGTDYRYTSWQPINTETTVAGTKPPYYGNIAVAAMLSPIHPSLAASDLPSSLLPSRRPKVSMAHIPLPTRRAAAYAAYLDDAFARLMVINLQAYNSTVNGTGTVPDPDAPERPVFRYTFEVPLQRGEARVQRLYANGSDAVSGIAWDGWSYNLELDEGRPVRLRNVTVGEKLPVRDGVVEVDVQASQAVLLSFVGET